MPAALTPPIPPGAPPHAVTRPRLLASFGLLLTLLVGPVAAAPPDFEAPYVAYEAGSKCGDVVPADLDGDGHLDLVIATTNPAAITIRLGTAEGTFPTSRVVSLGGSGVTTFSLADLNSDGHLDLIANNAPALSFQYRFGDGLGGFGPAQTISTGATIANVQAADFNEDGWPDLAYAYGSSFALRLGTGGGNFGPAAINSIGAGTQLTALVASDATGDGHADVTMVLHVGSTNMLWCQVGNGHGVLSGQFSTIATASTSIHLADMTGDGTLDALLAGPAGAAVSVARGLGGGLFTAGATLPVAPDTRQAVALDADGDGRLDVATGWQLFHANADGSYAAPVTPHLPLVYGVATGFLNADARPDLVVTNGYASVYVLHGLGDNAFGVLREGTLDRPIDWGARLIDLTGDGRLDLVTSMAAASGPGGVLQVRPGLGDGTFAPGIETQITGRAEGFVLGDFDGDAIPDIVYAYFDTGYNRTGFMKGHGDGTFGPTQFLWSSVDDPVAAADFNNDGLLDLVASYEIWVTVYPGLGNGLFDHANAVGLYAEGNSGGLIITDLNGDARPDVMSASAPRSCGWCGGDYIHYWLNDGGGGFGARRSLSEGHPLTGLAVGDFDEDGWLDAASTYWVQDPDLATERLVLFRGSGPGTFLAPVTFPMQAASRGLEAVDLEGDGHLDIVSAGYYSNVVTVLTGTGSGTFQPERSWGTQFAPAQVLLGRLDGDTNLDILALTSTFTPANPFAATTTQRYTWLRQSAAVSAVPDAPMGGPGLAPATPNPARGTASLRFTLPAPAHVRLDIFDVAGRPVAHLLDGLQPAGPQSVSWEGRDDAGRRVAPGVYFCRLASEGWQHSNRFVLLP